MDAPVAGAAEPEEQVVLGDDLAAGAGEVEGEGRHVAAEVVHVEDELLGQQVGGAPHDPADAEGREPVLVPGGVDGGDARQPEVPHHVGVEEGGDEAAAGPVHVDRDVPAVLGLDPVEFRCDLGDGLVVAGVGDADDGDDADGVLVDVLGELMGAQAGGVGLERDRAQFDVEVAGELLPADLDGPAHQVGPVDGEALGLAAGAPAEFEGEAAEHGGLAGPGGGAAGGRTADRRVPQVGQDVDAAGLDLGGLRVLVLVDHVLVEALVHQPVYAVVGPGGAEGGQVLGRVAVEEELVAEQLVDHLGGRVIVGHPVLGEDLAAQRGREHVRVGVTGGYVFRLMKSHIRTIGGRSPQGRLQPPPRRIRAPTPRASGRLRGVILSIGATRDGITYC